MRCVAQERTAVSVIKDGEPSLDHFIFNVFIMSTHEKCALLIANMDSLLVLFFARSFAPRTPEDGQNIHCRGISSHESAFSLASVVACVYLNSVCFRRYSRVYLPCLVALLLKLSCSAFRTCFYSPGARKNVKRELCSCAAQISRKDMRC